ncbi:hypothetical protein AJ79_08639 [Helicocarpus griseus UAMH5409]|uniref:Protein kinase domain-containing protein n=1 Tax=Helicocarpus griseus UAMH5409 TaxID=1447875 RepID=A0A2B7WRK8_9EURO|nr:hypothetical protein AJ79_08639 [Helicocarpus griseus UAMH5409]
MSDNFFGSVEKEDTIYHDKTGFNDNFKLNINFKKMEFEEVLNVSKASSIFHVNYCGKPRVLKVFHNNGDPGYAHDHIRDLNCSGCEIRAYCSLKRFKICDCGARHDTGLSCAILIEYLPKPLVMNCITYTKERMQKTVIGIQQVHLALVEHNDPYPKNILIVPGDFGRIVWVDFDVSIVYPNETYIGKKGRSRIEFETEVVKSFEQLLEEDQKIGLPPNTKYY